MAVVVAMITAGLLSKVQDDQVARYGSVPMVLTLGLSGSLLNHLFRTGHLDAGIGTGSFLALSVLAALGLSGLLLLLFLRWLETEQIVSCLVLVALGYLVGWVYWSSTDIAFMVLLDDLP